MGMGKTTQKMAEYGAKSSSAVEEILEKKIEDIVNLLGATERGKAHCMKTCSHWSSDACSGSPSSGAIMSRHPLLFFSE